jgi:heterodisulfide reductase subunit B
MNTKEYHEYLQSKTWREKAYQRMVIDGFECCGCGSRGSIDNKLECHHLSYTNIGYENIYTDLVTVCHCCHKNLHRIMERITDQSGRRGWKDAPRTPKIHVYTLSGLDIYCREGEI